MPLGELPKVNATKLGEQLQVRCSPCDPVVCPVPCTTDVIHVAAGMRKPEQCCAHWMAMRTSCASWAART